MLAFVIYKAVLCVVIFGISLGVAAYSTWWERKFASFLQDRVGPNRAGPFGLLQPLADGGKMFFKEEIIPNVSNKFLFILGPCLFMVTACMTSVVIPWGKDFVLGGRNFAFQIISLENKIKYVLLKL